MTSSATNVPEHKEVHVSVPDSPSITSHNSANKDSEIVSQEPLPLASTQNATAPTNLDEALEELLKHHEVLRAWLDHTRYFDIEHRKRELNYVKLKELEAERAKVLQEIHGSNLSEVLTPESPISARSTPTSTESQVRRTGYEQTPIPWKSIPHSNRTSTRNMPMNTETKAEWPPRGARYFLMKCYPPNNGRKSSSGRDISNIGHSKREGIWITQKKHEEKLATAFREGRPVFLFFSLNGSKAFQGYARMASAPSLKLRRPDWIASSDLTTSPPFKVEWLSTHTTEFSFFQHITNARKGSEKDAEGSYGREQHSREFKNKTVTEGHDGDEYCEDAGREMVAIMDPVEDDAPIVPVGRSSRQAHPPSANTNMYHKERENRNHLNSFRHPSQSPRRGVTVRSSGPSHRARPLPRLGFQNPWDNNQPGETGLRGSRWGQRGHSPSPQYSSPACGHCEEEDLLI